MCHVEAESMLEPRLSSIISLPVFAPERGSGARGASASPFGHGQRGVNVLKGLRVLVVEDDPETRRYYMSILEDDGFVVTLVFDAAVDRTQIVGLDARDLSASPLFVARLRHHVPYSLHGTFTPQQFERRK